MIKKLILRKNDSILVIGPSEIKLVKGKVEIFGKELKKGEKTLIERDKALPVKGLDNESLLMIILGYGGKIEKRKNIGVDIWRRDLEGMDLGKSIMVLGDDDSGKTGLTTFLINMFIKKDGKIGVIDADPGQGDLAEPTMIGSAIANKQVITLSQLNPYVKFFIGKTSPTGLEAKLEEGIKRLYEKLEKAGCKRIIVNMHGWIKDKRAVNHILRVKNLVKASSLLIIECIEEIPANEIDSEKKILKRPNTYRRTMSMRRRIRERRLKKYFLTGSFERKRINHGELPINGTKIFSGNAIDREMLMGVLRSRRIKTSRSEVIYGERIGENCNVLLVDKKSSNTLRILKFEFLEGKFRVYQSGREMGLVCGIMDRHENWHLGKLLSIDPYSKEWLFLIPSCVKEAVKITLGRLVLDRNNSEVFTIPFSFFS